MPLQLLSIGAQTRNFSELCEALETELKDPSNYAMPRKSYVEELIGQVDGKVSKRIVDYLLENKS